MKVMGEDHMQCSHWVCPSATKGCGTRCLGLGDSDSVTNIHVLEMGTDQESSLCFQRAISTLEAQLHWNLGSLAPPQRVYLSLPSVSPAFRLPPGGGMEDGAQEHKW